MQRRLWRLSVAIMLGGLLASGARAQTSWTWQHVKEKFEATNPTLKANQLSIDESRAAEITAFLRPNPDFGFATDGTQLTPYGGYYRPFIGTQFTTSLSYLHERQHKRELRRDSAKESTAIAESTYTDQERGLLFTLRNAFVQTLQARAVLQARRRIGVHTYVAREGGRTIGTASLLIEPKFSHRGGRAGHLEDVVVHPQHQGKGIGAALVRHVVDQARALGCYKVILNCSEKVKPFYARLGYQPHENTMRLDLPEKGP